MRPFLQIASCSASPQMIALLSLRYHPIISPSLYLSRWINRQPPPIQRFYTQDMMFSHSPYFLLLSPPVDQPIVPHPKHTMPKHEACNMRLIETWCQGDNVGNSFRQRRPIYLDEGADNNIGVTDEKESTIQVGDCLAGEGT